MEIIDMVIQEYSQGILKIPHSTPENQAYLRAYNESLTHKLEQKLEQLQLINRKLQITLEEKDQEMARRLALEEASHASEVKYQRLYESMIDAFVHTDLEGRIREFDQAYLNMMGYDSEEVTRLTFFDLTPAKWHDFENAIIEQQLMIRGYSDPYEKEYQKKDGSLVPIELRSYLARDQEGNPSGFWAIVRDINERKRAEEEKKRLEAQLLQAQKMESIGTLAVGIAHDFNNILTVIIGCAELALGDTSDPNTLKEDLEEILKASDRAKKMVNQILMFCRKAGNSYSPLEVDLAIKESLNMLRSAIPATIEIRQDLEPVGLVMSDLTQVHQITMNLGTGYSEKISEEKAKSMGTRVYIQKPLEMRNLSETIRSVLEVQHDSDPSISIRF